MTLIWLWFICTKLYKLHLELQQARIGMLRGIKKGKVDSGHTQRDQFEEDNEIQSKITKNQSNIKSQFIMEDQEEDQQSRMRVQNQDLQVKLTNTQRSELRQLDDEQVLRQKALNLMALFSQGKSEQLEQGFEDYLTTEKRYFIGKNKHQRAQQLKASLGASQGSYVQSHVKKSKFQYTMNFQQSDDEQKLEKRGKKHKKNNNKPTIKSQKVQDYCVHCPDNEELKILSASNYVYLAMAVRKTFRKYWHLILAPVEHQQTSIGLNEDTLTEINNYKKCLLQMFDQRKMHVVFFQQYCKQNSHIYIQCLAVPLNKAQDFPFFFKQALEGVQGNWTTHRNIIRIEKEKGGLQKQIPKKIKYFYIDFGLGYGYAHAIENDQFWKSDFCHQVLATGLGLQLYQVKTAEQFTDKEKQEKQEEFQAMWGPFDWTKYMN